MTSSGPSSGGSPFRSSPGTPDPGRGRLDITSRCVAFLALSLAALALGLVERRPILIATGEAGLALSALVWLYGRASARGLAAVRAHDPRAYEGDAVVVTLTLVNQSRLPLFMVRLVDAVPASAEPDRPLLLGAVRARGRGAVVSYSFPCDRGRGRYALGPVQASVPDPLGFFVRTRVLQAPSEILVLPRTVPLARLPFEGLRAAADASSDSPVRTGQSCTIMGTREYRPGDDVRHLHWRSSARWDRLVLKEFESITSREIAVALDLSRAAARGILGHANLEVSVRLAASIAERAAAARQPLQILGAGAGVDDDPLLVCVGTGAAHLERALETLALVSADGEAPLPAVLRAGLPGIPTGSTLFALIHRTDADLEAWAAALEELGRRSIRTVAVVVDDASFVRLRGPDPAEGARRLQALTGCLVGGGAEVYRFAFGDDLARVFSEAAR